MWAVSYHGVSFPVVFVPYLFSNIFDVIVNGELGLLGLPVEAREYAQPAERQHYPAQGDQQRLFGWRMEFFQTPCAFNTAAPYWPGFIWVWRIKMAIPPSIGGHRMFVAYPLVASYDTHGMRLGGLFLTPTPHGSRLAHTSPRHPYPRAVIKQCEMRFVGARPRPEPLHVMGINVWCAEEPLVAPVAWRSACLQHKAMLLREQC
ncbi:unnamed protein product, partial [Iphiclides podalirius]